MEHNTDVPDDGGLPTIDSAAFLRHGADVRVSNQEGFLCKVRMKALVDLVPEEVWIRSLSLASILAFSSG